MSKTLDDLALWGLRLEASDRFPEDFRARLAGWWEGLNSGSISDDKGESAILYYYFYLVFFFFLNQQAVNQSQMAAKGEPCSACNVVAKQPRALRWKVGPQSPKMAGGPFDEFKMAAASSTVHKMAAANLNDDKAGSARTQGHSGLPHRPKKPSGEMIG